LSGGRNKLPRARRRFGRSDIGGGMIAREAKPLTARLARPPPRARLQSHRAREPAALPRWESAAVDEGLGNCQHAPGQSSPAPQHPRRSWAQKEDRLAKAAERIPDAVSSDWRKWRTAMRS